MTADTIAIHDHTRKLICLSMIEHTNGIKVKPTERCTSERLPGASYCAHHLAEAARQFQEIIAAHTLGETP